MPTEARSTPDPSKGLPVVVPPSGKFIAQLFLVPAFIVLAIVGFLLTINWLVGGARSPADFLKKLDSANADVRWRGAEELAQVLQRNEQLASDPKFALDLTERLHRAMAELAIEERQAQERGPKTTAERQSLQARRDHVLYLSSCLANLLLPVGAPLLSDLAVQEEPGDAVTIAQRRRWAMWSLAKLGEGSKRFEKLAAIEREAILAELKEEASSSQERGNWARVAFDYLQRPASSSLAPLGVIKAFDQCSNGNDPFLREVTAFAMNFWDGTATENSRMEELLIRLSYDNGRGEDQLPKLSDEEETAETVITKIPGLKIRFNATIALARRGSNKVRIGLLQEMLDEAYLRQNFVRRLKDGREVPDEALVAKTLEATLAAVIELKKKNPRFDLSSLYPSIDALDEHANMALRTAASRTKIALGRN